MTPVISVDRVSKRFKIPLDHSTTLKYRMLHPRRTSRFRVLEAVNDVSFEVQAGEFLGITGPNGCGKSTLLKMLSDIYRPDTGEIHVNGSVSPFLELGVGFNPELTARENIFLGGSLIGMTRSSLRTRVDEILEFADLHDFADQRIKNFSSGMQVRLAFSVAIQANADLLLMDEVLAVGDARFQEKCFDVFASYRRDGKTVVLVTHDLGALDRYCDRVLLMTNGSLVDDGKPAEVTMRYRRMVGAGAAGDVEADGDASKRWGTREVQIEAVRFNGSVPPAIPPIVTAEPLTIEIDYLINSPLDEFACQVALRRDGDLEVASANSRADAYRVPGPPVGTRGTISYSVPQLNLLTGHYTVNIGLTDEHSAHIYDQIEAIATLRIGDDRNRSGLVPLNGTWHDSVVERVASPMIAS